MRDKQYWKDFFGAIWDIIICAFAVLLFLINGFIVYVILITVPWWIIALVVIIGFILWNAHSRAVEKAGQRADIDNEIKYLYQKNEEYQENIKKVYAVIAKATQEYDTEWEVTRIQFFEDKIEYNLVRIKELEAEKDMI